MTSVDRGRVLVTGADGFTGRYLCNELNTRGWEVWRSGLRSTDVKEKYIHLDLLDPDSFFTIGDIVRPDAVIHLAAASFTNQAEPQIFYQKNLIGTKLLLSSLSDCDHPPEHTILASSAAVYGDNNLKYLTEDATPAPTSDYGVSKLAVEILAKTYMGRLGISITRPFNYTGVGQDDIFVIPKIVQHFRSGAHRIFLGNTSVARDFSDVRDIAKYYSLILEAKPAGEVINLCSGNCYELNEILGICSELSGLSIEVKTNPELLRQSDVRVLRGDRTKLSSIIGKASPVPLEDTLKWMLS